MRGGHPGAYAEAKKNEVTGPTTYNVHVRSMVDIQILKNKSPSEMDVKSTDVSTPSEGEEKRRYRHVVLSKQA